MFKQVFILLGIPVIVGMIFAWKLPKVTAKIIKPIQRVSILVFMAIVVLAFVKNYDYFVQFIFLHHDCGIDSQSIGTHHRILTWPAYFRINRASQAHTHHRNRHTKLRTWHWYCCSTTEIFPEDLTHWRHALYCRMVGYLAYDLRNWHSRAFGQKYRLSKF
jgi:hypothetical protein